MRAFIAMAAIALGSCSDRRTPGNEVDLNAAAIQAQEDIDNYAAARPLRRQPLVAVRQGPSRVEPPATVVARYYALVGARRFAAAWSLWGDHGAACRRTAAQFAASLAPMGNIAAQVGAEQEPEAGAGQRYVTVPVAIHLTVQRGAPVQENARVTLHRVADGIESSDPEDHQWRITGMTMVPVEGSGRSAATSADHDLLMPCGSPAD